MAVSLVCDMKQRCLQIKIIGFWFYFDPRAVCFLSLCGFKMLQYLN